MRAHRTARPLEESSDPEKLAASFAAVLQSVRHHASAWPFLKPVTAAEVPDYYDHIKYPMDLKTMGERLKKGYYVTRRLFMADMARIFSNCRFYNSPETEYYRCANNLERYFQTKMRELGLWDKWCRALSANLEPPNEKLGDDDIDPKRPGDNSDDNDDDKKDPHDGRNVKNNLPNPSINNSSQNTLFNTFENNLLSGNLGVFSSLPDDIFTN